MSSFVATTTFKQIHAQQLTMIFKEASKQHDEERKPADAMQMAKAMTNTSVQPTLTEKQDAEETASKTKQSKRMWFRQLVLTQSHLAMMRARGQGR
jgi:hypothetical protein